ncbi:hypothetical protein KL905_000381 [Ogataea polymorpha]|nr:hypothetical protein KL908_001494 [Ogataea polymorpha]KAG7902374.1 hypothetical protein KL935_001282 [Ogataea polymorpha]KAG7911638.1 hypothetical protein KL906_000959 [Ogataea polymorpha]KAG7912528.1 hypothetical protein KL907_000730 [Ogataea polymorpha]KAG7919142.1 hypothetical protein KL927_001271 [Ogataea polymorpha]
MSSSTVFKQSYTMEAAGSGPREKQTLSFSHRQPISSHSPPSRRRKSSFTTSSSPYARRRSFLSKSMLENDNFQIYELSSSAPSACFVSEENGSRARIPSFSINLTQSQGFIWNQDLFASSYQQVRAGLNPDEFQEGSKSVEVVDIILDDDTDTENRAGSQKDPGHETKGGQESHEAACDDEGIFPVDY